MISGVHSIIKGIHEHLKFNPFYELKTKNCKETTKIRILQTTIKSWGVGEDCLVTSMLRKW